MKELQREGTAPEQIINDFLKEQNLQKEDVSYTIVDEGSKGFLSLFGRRPAVVSFKIKDEKETLLSFLRTLLKQMGVEYKSITHKKEGIYHRIHIQGVDNPGFLIGRDGRMVFSIEHLLNRTLEKDREKRGKVTLNVDNYKEKHEEIIIRKVQQITKRVVERESSITLEPMNAADRKTVHNFLEKDTQVKTMSIGKGDMRRIVIYPVSKGIGKDVEERSGGNKHSKNVGNNRKYNTGQPSRARAKYVRRNRPRRQTDNNEERSNRATE